MTEKAKLEVIETPAIPIKKPEKVGLAAFKSKRPDGDLRLFSDGERLCLGFVFVS
jgi:hypothetical protein